MSDPGPTDTALTAALAAADRQLAHVGTGLDELIARARRMLSTEGRTPAWALVSVRVGRELDCLDRRQRFAAELLAAAVLRLAEAGTGQPPDAATVPGKPDRPRHTVTAPPTPRSDPPMGGLPDDLYRTAYGLLNTALPRTDEFRRGVVETVAGVLGLDGPLGRLAVAERLGLDPAALYPPAAGDAADDTRDASTRRGDAALPYVDREEDQRLLRRHREE